MKNFTNKDIIKIIEEILKIRGGKGYSAGHVHSTSKIRQMHGLSDHHYEKIKKEKKEKVVVDISRAFKGSRHVEQ